MSRDRPAFAGPLGRFTFALSTAAVLAAQYAVVLAAYAAADRPRASTFLWYPSASSGQKPASELWFWLNPLRALANLEGVWPAALALACVFGLLSSALLAWLCFRRAGAIRRGYVLAPFVVTPILQVPIVLALLVAPKRSLNEVASRPDPSFAVATVVQGMLAGVGIVVFGVVLSALVFRSYGAGMFLLTPCLVGVTTAYIANRRAVHTIGRTMNLVIWSLAASGLALLVFALEGLICILMAAPLAIAMAALGALIGRSLAMAGRPFARPTAMSVAVLPLVFALEAATPPAVELKTHETIVIDAPPAAVWAALTDPGEIGPRPGVLFRLGLAYPVRGELRGEGVGAERIGVFSTGQARERITVWEPGRSLAFTVLANPPLMEEFSPYEHVHAPHVNGYFETAWTRFDLQPLSGGRTQLVERAAHTLRLDPVLYWAPLVRWGIERNNARVLNHIRTTAEAETARRSPTPRRPG